MRYLNEPIFNAAANSGTVNSSAVDATSMVTATLQVFFTDALAAGTLKLQSSNDVTNPTHWNDIASATVTVTGGAVSSTPVVNICSQWVRAVWTSTGGAGTFTANIKTIGY